MAGKHSKSFFDFSKSAYTTRESAPKQSFYSLSLPFKIILFVLVISLLLSSVLVGGFFMQSSSHKKLLANAKTVFNSKESTKSLKLLSEKNSDIIGWIKADGTNIDCAVCQNEDNSFYTNHNQLGKKSRYGALFLQNNDSFERKGGDKNIVIFGNNMKDGTMFGSLKKYRNLNFYKQNPTINLYYGDKQETYMIFAVMLVSAAGDNEDVYKPYKSHFMNESDFNLWRGDTLARSMIVSPIQPSYGDDLLTLVTVADDFDGARLVVMAKRTDEWDASHTNVISASVNPKTKYPKIWYTTRGLEYPH